MTVTLTEKQKRAVAWIIIESGEMEYGCTLTISMRKREATVCKTR